MSVAAGVCIDDGFSVVWRVGVPFWNGVWGFAARGDGFGWRVFLFWLGVGWGEAEMVFRSFDFYVIRRAGPLLFGPALLVLF